MTLQDPDSIAEIRRLNLLDLKSYCGTAAKLAERCDSSPQYMSQLMHRAPASRNQRKRAMGGDLARRLEQVFGLPPNSMDHPDAAAYLRGSTPQAAAVRPAPIAGRAAPAPLSLAEARSQYTAARPDAPWPFRGIAPADWAALDEGDRAAIEIYARALCDKRIARGA